MNFQSFGLLAFNVVSSSVIIFHTNVAKIREGRRKRASEKDTGGFLCTNESKHTSNNEHTRHAVTHFTIAELLYLKIGLAITLQ